MGIRKKMGYFGKQTTLRKFIINQGMDHYDIQYYCSLSQ